jgi:hypothetical protein
LDIFLRGFSLSSCIAHSLQVPYLYPTCLLKYVDCDRILHLFGLSLNLDLSPPTGSD